MTNEKLSKIIYENIKFNADLLNASMRQVCLSADVSVGVMHKLQHGRLPTVSTLVKFAALFNINASDLLIENGDHNEKN